MIIINLIKKEFFMIDCTYDNDNVFAKIIRGELPSKKVAETEFSLAFYDIHPMMPTHIMVIPKGQYRHYYHFIKAASAAEKNDLFNLVNKLADDLGLENFNLLANNGEGAGQAVPHFHIHLTSGRKPNFEQF
jgi:diadenosine tetraphosphate (Ap4A) HIT family hydrolase